mgnify:CR=1 FL=1
MKNTLQICKFCNFYTNDKEIINEHLDSEIHKIKLKKKGFFTCENCSFYSKEEKNLIQHINTCNEEKEKERE